MAGSTKTGFQVFFLCFFPISSLLMGILGRQYACGLMLLATCWLVGEILLPRRARPFNSLLGAVTNRLTRARP